MKIKKNKLYSYILMFLFVVSLSTGQIKAAQYENYYGVEMTNEQYNNLLELGFSEEEIYYMDEQTFTENKDMLATLVSRTEKYYKSVYTDLNGNSYSTEVSAEEYENQSSIQTRGYVETEYKKVVSSLSQLDNQFRYKVSTSWKMMPSVRSYDIIGVGHLDPVYIPGAVNFYYTYCIASGECITDRTYYNKQRTGGGGSAVYKFPSTARSMTAVLYYDVSKNTTDTITYLEICGDYAHATATVSSTQYNNHAIAIEGILLGTSTSNYYDAIPCAVSAWSGSW